MVSILNYIIFTDVGEEIDDEIALLVIINNIEKTNYIKNNNSFIYLTIVFTNGVPGTLNSQERFEIFKSYFPNWHSYNFINYIYDLSNLLLIEGKIYDKMLQIAPLTGVPYEFLSKNTFKNYYLMGQLNDSCINTYGSFNLEKNKDELELYNLQKESFKPANTTEISTLLCREIPFTSIIINSLPNEFKYKILEVAFKQFIGRVPPNFSYCYRVTFTINYKTLKEYIKNSNIRKLYKLSKILIYLKFILITVSILILIFHIIINNTINFNIIILIIINYLFKSYKTYIKSKENDYNLVKEFYNSIENKPNNYNEREDILKLLEMVDIVKFLTGETYIDSKFSCNSLSNTKKGFDKWCKTVLKSQCSFTPAYDLLTAFFMLEEENLSKETKIYLLDIKNINILKIMLDEFVLSNI